MEKKKGEKEISLTPFQYGPGIGYLVSSLSKQFSYCAVVSAHASQYEFSTCKKIEVLFDALVRWTM